MPIATTLLVLALVTQSAAAKVPSYDVPAQFVGDRIYVTPELIDGKKLRLYTDTGGGLFLTEQAVKRLQIPTEVMPADPSAPADTKSDPPPRMLAVLKFKSGYAIPLPADDGGKIAIMPADRVTKNDFTDDGMLGEAWFDGHVWTWDYPHKKLTVEGSAWKPKTAAKRIVLGFKNNADGTRDGNFARITIRVDGKPIDVLLDTGATTTLTPEALKVLADKEPAERATSMIVATQFDAWRKLHPDWRVIENAQAHSHSAMIEVPLVEIAGSSVGPVWFTWRPDKNFHEFMSSMMDAQVEGAIGGNALRHFAMTIDYPGAAAYFVCVKECGGNQ